MKSFKELFQSEAHLHSNFIPTVSLKLKDHSYTLNLKFSAKDVISEASYNGKANPWFSSLCELVQGKSLHEALHINWKNWDEAFKSDQSYWEFKQDQQLEVFLSALELLKATLDVYRGRDFLYQPTSPLICRCFGIREADITDHLKSQKDPSLLTIASSLKAGMGCRSCVKELKRALMLHSPKIRQRVYKDKPMADWILEIDYMLTCFPEALDWKMQLDSFKGKQVVISFAKDVSQREEEEVAGRLQLFLSAGVDDGLGFFLRRDRQRSKNAE